jgi:murein DD-endopeptidase MepM/ murein hydrolase activator NlpD
VGEIVPRGATLGLSGATGLAGGDHLHFAIQASGTYVEPKEWWDARWVKDRFEGLQAAP